MPVRLKPLRFAALALCVFTGVLFSSATIRAQSPLEQPVPRSSPSLVAQGVNQSRAEQVLNEGFQLFQQGTAESLRQALAKMEQALSLYRQEGERRGEALSSGSSLR